MSYDLVVSYPDLPAGLAARWEAGFHGLGFDVEVYPAFDASTWTGGFLPFHVRRAPAEMAGYVLPDPAMCGFEAEFEPTQAFLRTALGRSSLEHCIQHLGAALLAQLSGGRVIDPQSGAVREGIAALEDARRSVVAFVDTAEADQLVHRSFPGWDVLRG